jgi:hypothetical protein
MTEEEWKVSTDFGRVLALAYDGPVSCRKNTLFDCACFRRVWSLLSEKQRQSVARLEEKAEKDADCILAAMELGIDAWRAAEIKQKAGGDFEHERAAQISLLRDIFGSPFRPVTLDPSWLTSTVTALAHGIYADRAFDRLPILADALQDAGCDHPDVLAHCRGPGPHARGCWVVDLILGKS